ncbi:MAG: YggU family protein [Gammaproteobacteria bacterium]|nr:MAG: YggU family protein [Gammaproteobacteria bacterium]
MVCTLRIQPRASRDDFAGIVGDRMKIRIRSSPVDGAANEALIKFLASRFGVNRSSVRLVSGHRNRNKVVEIESPGRIPEELQGHID